MPHWQCVLLLIDNNYGNVTNFGKPCHRLTNNNLINEYINNNDIDNVTKYVKIKKNIF